MVTVTGVVKSSRAQKAGILPGDIIISIDGNEINDILDFDFYTASKKCVMKIHRGSELFDVTLKKGEYERTGLEFATYLMDEKKSCRNKCVFCFIDQLPHGMRDSLYFKDDDSRMSFLAGSYVTMTNMNAHDIGRIMQMHISPINVSVHTTDPELRVKMLGNRHAGNIMETLRTLAGAGIMINAQIVMCPGLNDGEELVRTMRELITLAPSLQSIAVVPVGLTCHRDGLYPLRLPTPEECAKTIADVTALGDECVGKYGARLCYPADELYISAGLDIPDDDFYDDYPQLDNGVGLIRLFFSDFEAYINDRLPDPPKETVTLVTGTAAFEYMKKAVDMLCRKWYNIFDTVNESVQSTLFAGKIRVFAVRNDFFGKSVTVAGLVTAGDIAAQLPAVSPLGTVVVPDVMLRHDEDVFLDGVTLDGLARTLGTHVVSSPSGGESFADIFAMLCRGE